MNKWVSWFQLILTSKPVDETLVCDLSTESYQTELLRDNVYYALQGVPTFRSKP